MADDQKRAEPERRRLQHHPHCLRQTAVKAYDVRRAFDGREISRVEGQPAVRQGALHPHRKGRFGIASVCLKTGRACLGNSVRLANRAAAGPFRQQGRAGKHETAAERQHSQPGVDQHADQQKDRDPRQVDEADRALPGEKAPHLVEVADRLGGVAGLLARGGQPDDRGMRNCGEVPVEKPGRARHDAVADQVQGGLKGECAAQQERQGDQSGNALAGEHPIVDLQHVERTGEHQDVHHRGEQRHSPYDATAVLERRLDGRVKGGGPGTLGR